MAKAESRLAGTQLETARRETLRTVSRALASASILVGCLVLVGWAFDIDALKRVIPGSVTLKVNGAIAFALAGVSLWLLNSEARWARLAVKLGAAFVALVGLLSLSEYLFGWNLGIDQLLFAEPAGAGTVAPGRVVPNAALSLIFIGLSLLLLATADRRKHLLGQLSALVPALVALLAFIGYAYGIEELYGLSHVSRMAVHAAFCIGVLAVGLLFARPDSGFMAVVTSETAGGMMARLAIPAVVALPPFLGGLALIGYHAELYDAEIAIALLALSCVVVFAVLLSISARALYRVDLERRRVEEAAARLAAIVDSSDDAIVGKTLEGVILNWNPGAERLYGYSAQEAIGRPISMLVPSDRPDELSGLLERVGRGEHIDHFESIRVRKDGRRVDVSLSLSPIKDETGQIVGASTIARDITEKKQTEERLAQQARELARSVDELQQFAYVASHDLQEPLRMVASYVQLLARRYQGRLDADADEFIGYAVDGAKRMQQLINDLLAYSRVGTRGRPFESTDASASLKEALANLQMAVEETGASVTADPLPKVYADPIQLTQLFQNLVGNAIKYHGEERPRVHVSAEDAGNAWRFSVRDNGIGIAAEYRERIFLIFQRLHSRDEYAGTGIGLAVCKKIVERHGGQIWVESEPGRGSTFYFTLLKQPKREVAS